MEDKFKLFMDVWGEKAQIMMCVEEMSELTKELCKYLRYENTDISTDNILEELADVRNCIEQLCMHFGKEKVEEIQNKKIERTIKKLEGEYLDKNSSTKIIELDDVILRPFKYDDAQQMFDNYCSDNEVTKYLPWSTYDSVKGVQNYLKSFLYKYNTNNFFEWAIEYKSTKQVVGAISFTVKGKEVGELGYVLSKKMWGKGIIPRSAKAVTDYIFSLGFKKIFAKCQIANQKSEKVMQKIGMEFEGISRKADYNNCGELVDFKVYSITKYK